MRLAARFGGWVTTGHPADTQDEWWQGVAELAALFDGIVVENDGVADTAPRYLSLDSAPVFSLTSVGAFTDAAGRAAELGFTDIVIHWPRSTGPYAGRETVLEQVVSDVLPGLRNSA